MKKISFLGLILSLFISPSAFSEENKIQLLPFSSDYCTMFPEGTFVRPNIWKHCCFDHDLRYWFGGTKTDLKFADINLKACVTKVAGNFFGNLMYYGVRSGHYSPIKNEHKWGWGWSERRKAYTKLTTPEKKTIILHLNQLDLETKYLENFMKLYGFN